MRDTNLTTNNVAVLAATFGGVSFCGNSVSSALTMLFLVPLVDPLRPFRIEVQRPPKTWKNLRGFNIFPATNNRCTMCRGCP